MGILPEIIVYVSCMYVETRQ